MPLPAVLIAALDLVFPALCPVCDTALGAGRRDPLCGACWGGIARIEPPCCATCGAPCAIESAVAAAGRSLTCAPCSSSPPTFDFARSAARYEGPLRDALVAFKFGGWRALARPLADLLVEQCGASLPGSPTVVPVPLARDREYQRGFNQARLLAERVARRLGAPLEPGWLARVRETRPQTDLSAAERRANVRGAFRAPRAAAGHDVLLVDDVLTTGATLGECARTLRAAGARRIGVLTVARVD